jgi:hypothetical protein
VLPRDVGVLVLRGRDLADDEKFAREVKRGRSTRRTLIS